MTNQPTRYDAHRAAVRPLRPAVIALTFEVAFRREERNARRSLTPTK